jgi:hypothetical protein
MADVITAEELPPLLTPKQLAAFIHSTEAALSQDRYLGKGIPYTRIGARIRYLRADVLAHLAAHRITGPAA